MKTWYTYHIIDPENNKVFYVGKGYGKRAYIHMNRALKWRQTGKIISGGNKHLYNKLLKIHDKNLQPIYLIVFSSTTEKEVLDREELDIRTFGLDNLCNLTHGGEGETRSAESLEKLSKSLREFWNSDAGCAMKQRFSEERLGSNNPMWGTKLDETTIKEKVYAMLSVPRWNKGLKGDSRLSGHPKGEPTHNSLLCSLTNNNGEVFEARSLSELSKISGVPLISINRLRAGKNNKKGWTLKVKTTD